jgi:polyisoprenoid-binding protein YceI
MATTTWTLDPTHSDLQFKIKHLMISTVTGQFDRFEATVSMQEEDFSTATVKFAADIDSISTNNQKRDEHLKNGDFFDLGNHPRLTFESDKVDKVDDENYKVHGVLSMRGTSKPVTLDVEFGGIVKDPWGLRRAGASISAKVKRTDFGVSFGSAPNATGELMLGDEVKINGNVEFVKAEAQKA